MDPITLALATFGIQKLRGKSTKRSFRDALIAGGIGQLGSMTSMGDNGIKGLNCLKFEGHFFKFTFAPKGMLSAPVLVSS